MTEVVILAGRPGTGKSYNALSIANEKQQRDKKPILGIDTEKKMERTKEIHFPSMEIEIKDCLKFTEKYEIDAVATLNEIRKAQESTLTKDYSTVILDSTVGLRTPLCEHEWLVENKRKKAMTIGDWADIRSKVDAILYPLINLARSTDTMFIMCVEIGDRYESGDPKTPGVIVGEEVKIKSNIEFLSTYVIKLSSEEGKYDVKIIKSPRGYFQLSHKEIYEKSIYPFMI